MELSEGIEHLGKKCISGTNIKQIVIPSSIKRLDDEVFKCAEALRYVILLCPISEDWGTELFPKGCIVLYNGEDVAETMRKIDNRKYAEWAAEQQDWDNYLRDSFYAAYEGEYDPNGDWL